MQVLRRRDMNNLLALDNKMHGVKPLATTDILINAVLFQICWFTAVLAGGFWAILPVSLMLAQHLMAMRPASLLILCLLAGFGIFIDSIYLSLHVYDFAESPVIPLLNLPVWLACLWLAFCLSLPVSLAWLVRKPYFFVLACAVFGPLSYLAGRHWQVVNFADHEVVLLALEWSVFSIVAIVLLKARSAESFEPDTASGNDKV